MVIPGFLLSLSYPSFLTLAEFLENYVSLTRQGIFPLIRKIRLYRIIIQCSNVQTVTALVFCFIDSIFYIEFHNAQVFEKNLLLLGIPKTFFMSAKGQLKKFPTIPISNSHECPQLLHVLIFFHQVSQR